LGELVFEFNNFRVNAPQKGCNRFFRGETLNPNVFVYLVKAVLIDGQKIIKKGDLTLLR